MKVKICGIKDPEMALFAARSGADLIGIVREKGSKRYVSLELAREIALAAKEGGAKSVAVYIDFKEEDLPVDLIQFYRGIPKGPYGYIYANQPNALLREGKDFLLIDSQAPGRGSL